jgi:peptidoglycan/LPS O-acetylase OafA/YrhL
VGVLAAVIYSDRDRFSWTANSRTGRLLFWSGAGVVGGLLLSREMLADPIGLFDITLQPLALAAGSGAVVLALALGFGPVPWFSGQRMFYISKLSYSLYLVHLLVIPATIAGLESIEGFGALPPVARFGLFLAPYLAAAALAAGTVFYLVEQPFLRLKDRLGSPPGPGAP